MPHRSLHGLVVLTSLLALLSVKLLGLSGCGDDFASSEDTGSSTAGGGAATATATGVDPTTTGVDPTTTAVESTTSTGPAEQDSGSDDSDGDDSTGERPLNPCRHDEFVDGGQCEPCPAGSTNEAGDDPAGKDTRCDRTLCGDDEFVQDNTCVGCPAGTTNEAGDDPSLGNTACDASLCEEDEFVSRNACTACAPGTENGAGDDASGPNTMCEVVLCGADEFVQSNACMACAAGATNMAGDDASGSDTICDATLCPSNQQVLMNVCALCPPGTSNEAGDDATGPDTDCDTIFCGEDEFVSANACADCAAGTENEAGDDASMADTNCDVILCGENEFVSSNVCMDCPDGTLNEAGDDATGPDTSCEDPCEAAFGITCDIFDEAFIKTSNAGLSDFGGRSVAISGDTLVVGADVEDSSATGIGGDEADNSAVSSGAVYVFRRAGVVWAQEAYIKASNAEAGDQFGISVALSGDTLAVGAVGEDSNAIGVGAAQSDNSAMDAGAVYVFQRTGTTWVQEEYLKASNTSASQSFGASLALSGDTLVVGGLDSSNATGVNGDDGNTDAPESGAVYVFERSGAGWEQQAYIKGSNTESGDFFGWSVALSGDTLAIGAPGEDGEDDSFSTSGAVYVFLRTGSVWAQEAVIRASSPDNTDTFGEAVALSGDTLAVGVPREDSDGTGEGNDGATNSGAVFVFERTGALWEQEAYLKASNLETLDGFGSSVALVGDVLAVGARAEDSNATGVNGEQGDNSASSSGAAYVFRRSGSVWAQQAYVKASNTDAFDRFGRTLALDGNTLVVAATEEDSGVGGDQSNNDVSNSGAVYVRRIAP